MDIKLKVRLAAYTNIKNIPDSGNVLPSNPDLSEINQRLDNVESDLLDVKEEINKINNELVNNYVTVDKAVTHEVLETTVQESVNTAISADVQEIVKEQVKEEIASGAVESITYGEF